MKVYLMQHAFAYSTEEDPERPLSPEGIAQAKSAAKGIKRLGLAFDLIASSPKRRAHQTAALIAEGVRYPHTDILTTEALLPEGPPQAIFELMEKETPQSSLLLVGHLPQLAHLSALFLHGGELTFENACLACFDVSCRDKPRLEFLLKASQLGV